MRRPLRFGAVWLVPRSENLFDEPFDQDVLIGAQPFVLRYYFWSGVPTRYSLSFILGQYSQVYDFKEDSTPMCGRVDVRSSIWFANHQPDEVIAHARLFYRERSYRKDALTPAQFARERALTPTQPNKTAQFR